MVAVPLLTPVTLPPVPTVAAPAGNELHAPPAVASLSDVALPTHTVAVPDIAAGVDGAEFMVITCVAAILPHPFVTV